MESPDGEAHALSRRTRYLGIPLAGLLFTLFFVHCGFPYELIVAKHLRAIEASQKLTVRYSEVSSHVGLFGPGVVAHDVVVSRPGADDVEMDPLIVRPAWSLAWFALEPALHFDARMPAGHAKGSVNLSTLPNFDGSFVDFDLAALPGALPSASYAAGLGLKGSVDADVEFHYDEQGALLGSAEISAEDGSISLPGQPLAIPFDSFDAQLSLGSEEGEFLTIDSVEFAGPMVSASASGYVAQGNAQGKTGPGEIDIELKFTVVDEGMQPAVRALGIALDRNGTAAVQLGGTLASPVLR